MRQPRPTPRTSTLAALLCLAAGCLSPVDGAPAPAAAAAPSAAPFADQTSRPTPSPDGETELPLIGAWGADATPDSEGGARLPYAFATGEGAVAATLSLPAPTPFTGVRFRARLPAGVRLVVEARGEGLPTTPWPAPRPLHARDPEETYEQTLWLHPPLTDAPVFPLGSTAFEVKSLTFRVQPLRGVRSSGEAWVGDVRGLSGEVAIRLDPRSPAWAPAPPQARDLFDGVGVNLHSLDFMDLKGFPQHYWPYDDALALAREAGFRGVRMDLFWNSIERTPGVFFWDEADALVRMAEEHRLWVLWILGYGNEHYTPQGNAPARSAEVTAFVRYAEQSARRYAGRAVRYQVWNEANLNSYWKPKADAAKYTALAKATVEAVRREDAHAPLTLTGVTLYDFGFIERYLRAGAAKDVRVISLNPYYTQDTVYPESDEAAYLRDLVGRHVQAPFELWDTESGVTSRAWGPGDAPENRWRQATWVPRKILAARAKGFSSTIVYGLRDKTQVSCTEVTCTEQHLPGEWEHNFGLLTHDLKPKPAYHAVRALNAFTQHRTFSALHPTGLGWQLARFDGEADDVFVVWPDFHWKVTRAQKRVRVRAPVGTRAYDLFGEPLPFGDAVTAGEAWVEDFDGPSYWVVPHAR